MQIMSRVVRSGALMRLRVPERQAFSFERRLVVPPRQLVVKVQQPKEFPSVPPETPELIAAIEEIKAMANTPHKQLALLLPAHNEELILEATIRSAIAAGQPVEDIFVVDDGSTDDTRAIATRLLGKSHVISVKRSGKSLAVKKAIVKFKVVTNYVWLHIADADSVFSQDYFRHYRSKLDPKKYAVAVGFVQSLRGNWISTYRALTYTYSQQVTRRVQSHLGMISVFPGPITCFRTDIISKLDFNGISLTEDFDITLQVHRKKLGKILFIPQAVNFTQDPQTLKDFCKQNLRWQRGFFQGVKKYKIGLRAQRIDASLGYQMLQNILFLLQVFVLLPFVVVTTHNWLVIPVFIAADIVVNGIIALFASVAAKRWMLLGALPYFHFLRWIEIGIYLQAFVEVMVLGRFKDKVVGWSTEGRRYKLSEQALLDGAH
jgi:cellulose synthase/poly-beta-1,6-N-acetylglucosamine synthase-like glycosyltransferase